MKKYIVSSNILINTLPCIGVIETNYEKNNELKVIAICGFYDDKENREKSIIDAEKIARLFNENPD